MNMRVVRIITGMSLLTLFFVMGCRDVFEKDISEKEVVLVAPADSVETTRATLTFAWEERDGATGYRLVVVSPSFDRIELYVLDTLVEGNQYAYTLEPGRYEWGVRPENSAYEGIYRWRVLTVLENAEELQPEEQP